MAFQNIMRVGDQKLMIDLEWPHGLLVPPPHPQIKGFSTIMIGYKNIHAVIYSLKLILTHFQLAADCMIMT